MLSYDCIASDAPAGDRRDTVLLHGFLGAGKNLRSLASAWLALDVGRRFWLLDLPGHGASPPLSSPPSLRALAEAVHDWVLSSLPGGDLRVDVVGHSLGGRVGLSLSTLAPQVVGRVVLLDITPGRVPERGRQETAAVVEALLAAPEVAKDRATMRDELTRRALSRPLAEWLAMNLRPDVGGVRWSIDRQALKDLHDGVLDAELWSAAEALGSRLHCVVGERSSFVEDDDRRRLERLGATVHVLPGAGHYVHVDARDALVSWLLQTLA